MPPFRKLDLNFQPKDKIVDVLYSVQDKECKECRICLKILILDGVDTKIVFLFTLKNSVD